MVDLLDGQRRDKRRATSESRPRSSSAASNKQLTLRHPLALAVFAAAGVATTNVVLIAVGLADRGGGDVAPMGVTPTPASAYPLGGDDGPGVNPGSWVGLFDHRPGYGSGGEGHVQAGSSEVAVPRFGYGSSGLG